MAEFRADGPCLQVLGDSTAPFSGRCWVRTFAEGHKEILYRSGEGPSELERFNAWMTDAGMGRVYSLGRPRTPLTIAEERERAAKYELTPEENQARSLRRARQRLRWSVKAIGADHMLTLTYRENQTDLALATKHLQKFMALCRKEWPTWRYVATPEEQERGAWHWHVAVRGYINYDKLRGYWYKAMGFRVVWSAEGKPVLADASETPGNVQGRMPKQKRTWDVDRLAGYLAKYLGKALSSGHGGKSYSVSRGLRWTVERYVVRALTFEGVAGVLLDLFSAQGVACPYIWQHPARKVVWAAGQASTPTG